MGKGRYGRVVVTGGAGFIGSELVRQLAGQGAAVTIVDNLVTGRRENLRGLPPAAVTLEVADVRDLDTLRTIVAGADIVYHLACLGVRHSIHSPIENHDVNATATLDLVKVAREGGVRRFVHVSSSEVYGTARRTPMSERHPTYPTTVYGASKLAGECYVRAFHDTYGFPSVVVRPFNAYGPRSHHEGDSGEVIPRMMLRCLAGWPLVVFGDGRQTRDFTFVSDIARGIMLAGISAGAVGETINLGSGREVAIKDLAVLIAEVAGAEGTPIELRPPRPGDVRRLRADASRANALLGFEPAVTLRDGLALLRDWYRRSGSAPEELLSQEVERNWEGVG